MYTTMKQLDQLFVKVQIKTTLAAIKPIPEEQKQAFVRRFPCENPMFENLEFNMDEFKKAVQRVEEQFVAFEKEHPLIYEKSFTMFTMKISMDSVKNLEDYFFTLAPNIEKLVKFERLNGLQQGQRSDACRENMIQKLKFSYVMNEAQLQGMGLGSGEAPDQALPIPNMPQFDAVAREAASIYRELSAIILQEVQEYE